MNLPRGICSVCGKDVAIRRNGEVREHTRPGGQGVTRWGNAAVPCPGSGKPPLPNPARVLIEETA